MSERFEDEGEGIEWYLGEKRRGEGREGTDSTRQIRSEEWEDRGSRRRGRETGGREELKSGREERIKGR